MGNAADNSLNQIADISEIQRVGSVAVDRQRQASQSILDERLSDTAANTTLAVKRRWPHYRIRQIKNLIISDHQLFAAVFERTVNSQWFAVALLIDRIALKIAVYRWRRRNR